MNVLIISDYAAPYAGNFIRSIQRLCEKMEQRQHGMQFAFPDKCRQMDWALDLEKRYKINYKIDFGNLLSQIRRNSVNVVYTHFCLPRTQCYAKAAARISRVPLVQHWHNHYQRSHGIKGMLSNWAFMGDMNIGCSKSVMDSLPYSTDIKTYVDNAIDFSRLDCYEPSFRFEGCPSAKVVLMFGFDLYRKGVDLVLEAMAPIAQQKKMNLVISLSKNHEKIHSYIQKKFGCQPDWVHIVDARDDVATYYRAADIFISAAREEGFCYALVEAAYCGCDTISSEIDGVPYKQIPYCRTFPNGSVSLLQRALLAGMVPNTLEQKNEATEAVVAQFDLNRWAENEVAILERVAWSCHALPRDSMRF